MTYEIIMQGAISLWSYTRYESELVLPVTKMRNLVQKAESPSKSKGRLHS